MESTTWLAEEIYKRGWSQSELARRAGISQQTVSAIINARNKPSTQTCKALSKALNMPLQTILEKFHTINPKPRSKEAKISQYLPLLSDKELTAILTIVKNLSRRQ